MLKVFPALKESVFVFSSIFAASVLVKEIVHLTNKIQVSFV